MPLYLYESYKERHEERYLKWYRAISGVMTTNTLVKIKEAPAAYHPIKLETPVLLHCLACTSPDWKTGSYTFKQNQPTKMKQNLANVKAFFLGVQVSQVADSLTQD
jgi:hypothetical protein